MGQIIVLTGTNGAGKSSVGGTRLRDTGADYYNPDEETRAILKANPGMDPAEANSLAWKKNRDQLQEAIDTDANYGFETTLGGNTITRLLIEGAEKSGAVLRVWFCGLAVISQ
jgi:predicted ABC-type ATPase